METRKRKRPSQGRTKGKAMSKLFSVREFFAEFPNDDACLKAGYGSTLWASPCMRSACGVEETTFHKITGPHAFAVFSLRCATFIRAQGTGP